MDFGGKTKNQKTAENKRKKRKDSMSSVNDDDDVDLDGMDWWSKYHASVELLLSVICSKQMPLIHACTPASVTCWYVYQLKLSEKFD